MNLPKAWMPKANMSRIICHWTAGSHSASDVDKKHYHIIVEGSGQFVRGNHSIKANEKPIKGKYAAHTLNCNTGSIGVSMCCMYGAKENPFKSGKYPMTKAQWDAMVDAVARLCIEYDIVVTPKTVLSHAEVQANLGIKQRGKWDFTRLSFDPGPKGAKACGDKLRKEVSAMMDKIIMPPPPPPPPPPKPVVVVNPNGEVEPQDNFIAAFFRALGRWFGGQK